MNQIKIEVLKPLGAYSPGDIVKVETDELGIPKKYYWRLRLSDAEKDHCCRVIKPSMMKPRKTPKPKKQVKSNRR